MLSLSYFSILADGRVDHVQTWGQDLGARAGGMNCLAGESYTCSSQLWPFAMAAVE